MDMRIARYKVRKHVVGIIAVVVVLLLSANSRADEIRIVDGQGLVRAVKITRGAARVVVTLETPLGSIPSGECRATNVDGLAPEKRVQVSGRGECVFVDVTAGSWQISVPQALRWRVKLYE